MLADCDDDDRKGFIQKVYGILASQLTVTFGFTAIVTTSASLTQSMQSDTVQIVGIVAIVLALFI